MKMGMEGPKLEAMEEQVESAMIARCGMTRHSTKSPNRIQRLLSTSTENSFCA